MKPEILVKFKKFASSRLLSNIPHVLKIVKKL